MTKREELGPCICGIDGTGDEKHHPDCPRYTALPNKPVVQFKGERDGFFRGARIRKR